MYRPRSSTKQKIYWYIKNNGGWVSGTELEAMAEEWQTKSSVISRRARDLEKAGSLEKAYSTRHTVQYRIRQPYKKPSMTAEEATKFLHQLRQESLYE